MSERLELFAQIADEVGGTFRGQYRGRCFHEGIAVDFDDGQQLIDFVVEAGSEESLAPVFSHRVHQDSMGRGIVASWDRKAWTEEEWAAANTLVQS